MDPFAQINKLENKKYPLSFPYCANIFGVSIITRQYIIFVFICL